MQGSGNTTCHCCKMTSQPGWLFPLVEQKSRFHLLCLWCWLILLLPHHFLLMSLSPPLPVNCYVNFFEIWWHSCCHIHCADAATMSTSACWCRCCCYLPLPLLVICYWWIIFMILMVLSPSCTLAIAAATFTSFCYAITARFCCFFSSLLLGHWQTELKQLLLMLPALYLQLCSHHLCLLACSEGLRMNAVLQHAAAAPHRSVCHWAMQRAWCCCGISWQSATISLLRLMPPCKAKIVTVQSNAALQHSAAALHRLLCSWETWRNWCY